MAKQPDMNKIRAQIIAKAWKDPAFKQKLLKNPKAALKEMGWDVPGNIDVRIVEDKQNSFTFVLPASITNMHELTDQELEKLAGGADRETKGLECGGQLFTKDKSDIQHCARPT